MNVMFLLFTANRIEVNQPITQTYLKQQDYFSAFGRAKTGTFFEIICTAVLFLTGRK